MTEPPTTPRLIWYAPQTWGCRGLWGMLLVVIIGTALVWISTTPRGPTACVKSAPAMQRAILKHVPIGTDIEVAREFLLKERFHHVEDYTNNMFSMTAADSGGATRHGLNFAFYERSDPSFMEVRIWGVALVMTDEKVTEVLVRAQTFGP